MSKLFSKSGLLWAVCAIALAGVTFSGSAANGNRGGAPELSGALAQQGAPAADSSLILTAHRMPVNQARVRVLSPKGDRLSSGVSKTDRSGFTSISIPEGTEFKLEIKVGRHIYLTNVYTAPTAVRFDPFNTAPIATDLAVEAVSGEVTAITLIGTDADGDALTYEVLSSPDNGILTGTAPDLIYTPNANFAGGDSFSYKVSDGIAESAVSTVSIDVTKPFIISVDATDGTFTIPLKPGLGYDFTVTFDGQNVKHSSDSGLTLVFPNGAGTYDVAISGTFPAIFFNNSGDKTKLLEVKQWGSIAWETMESAFDSCSNMTVTATDTPNLSNVTNTNNMFWKCRALTSLDVTDWDVSNVTSMVQMFRGCSNLTSYVGLNTWDVSNVTAFHRMFYYNLKLTELDLSGWQTSSATDMSYMFYRCYSLTDLTGYENWDVSNVTTFRLMFERLAQSSLNLSNWNTTDALTDIRQMFAGSRVSKIDGLEYLDVTNVLFADGMFNKSHFQMTTEQYDALLVNWAAEVSGPALGEVTFDAGDVQYTPFSSAASARASLIAKNWIINDGGSVVGVDSGVTESITSPVRVSGWDTIGEGAFTISTDGSTYQPVTVWGDTLWYHDVTLSTSGTVPVSIKYDGSLVESRDILWTPTLVNDDTSQSVTIRKGSSLLFGSAVTTGTLLELDVDGDGAFDLSGAPTDLFPVPYNEYGTYEVYTRVDGVDAGVMVVDVPQIIFPDSIACQIGYTREVVVGVPDASAGITFIPNYPGKLRIVLSEEETLPGIVVLNVTPLAEGTQAITAMGPTGPLASKELDTFNLWSDGQDYFFIVDSFEDGSKLSTSHIVMKPKVDNLKVRIRVNKVGVTLDDSTLERYVNTNDFVYNEIYDAYIHPYSMIINGDFNAAPCHTATAFQTAKTDSPDSSKQQVSKDVSINGTGVEVSSTPKAVAKGSGDEFKITAKLKDPKKGPVDMHLALANDSRGFQLTEPSPSKEWNVDISSEDAAWYELKATVDNVAKKLPDKIAKLAVIEAEFEDDYVYLPDSGSLLGAVDTYALVKPDGASSLLRADITQFRGANIKVKQTNLSSSIRFSLWSPTAGMGTARIRLKLDGKILDKIQAEKIKLILPKEEDLKIVNSKTESLTVPFSTLVTTPEYFEYDLDSTKDYVGTFGQSSNVFTPGGDKDVFKDGKRPAVTRMEGTVYAEFDNGQLLDWYIWGTITVENAPPEIVQVVPPGSPAFLGGEINTEGFIVVRDIDSDVANLTSSVAFKEHDSPTKLGKLDSAPSWDNVANQPDLRKLRIVVTSPDEERIWKHHKRISVSFGGQVEGGVVIAGAAISAGAQVNVDFRVPISNVSGAVASALTQTLRNGNPATSFSDIGCEAFETALKSALKDMGVDTTQVNFKYGGVIQDEHGSSVDIEDQFDFSSTKGTAGVGKIDIFFANP